MVSFATFLLTVTCANVKRSSLMTDQFKSFPQLLVWFAFEMAEMVSDYFSIRQQRIANIFDDAGSVSFFEYLWQIFSPWRFDSGFSGRLAVVFATEACCYFCVIWSNVQWICSVFCWVSSLLHGGSTSSRARTLQKFGWFGHSTLASPELTHVFVLM